MSPVTHPFYPTQLGREKLASCHPAHHDCVVGTAVGEHPHFHMVSDGAFKDVTDAYKFEEHMNAHSCFTSHIHTDFHNYNMDLFS